MSYNPPKPRDDLIWIGVDLDGCIAKPIWRADNPTSEIGDPIWENVEKLKSSVEKGYKVVIHTSRPWTDYEAIEYWLNYWDIPFKEIQCGKPLYKAYVDDRAVHCDEPEWI
jgi:hypothetical protein